MGWCASCGKVVVTERDEINGFTCCTGCGRVLDDNVYSSDPMFSKGAGGQSQMEGNYVRDGQHSGFGRFGGRTLGTQSDSHEKTLNKGRLEIVEIVERLHIRPREDVVSAAHRLYTIAVERNFTRGRRTNQVAGACLYIVCRQENKPYMLIDFSDSLQVNVYVLGAVFLQLGRLLRLDQHPIMQKPVDPSLFIHRFADRLQFGKKMHTVANTALRLVASMKRDWMQTGRRPSGICGAALFISSHIYGFQHTKSDVVSVVHICEATLKKRLNEFETTESGQLTAEEFEAKAKEIELQMQTFDASLDPNGLGGISEILCEHKNFGAVHYAHGLCRGCYDEFVKVSGGIRGGSAPPAFQRAEQKRLKEAKAQELRAMEVGNLLHDGVASFSPEGVVVSGGGSEMSGDCTRAKGITAEHDNGQIPQDSYGLDCIARGMTNDDRLEDYVVSRGHDVMEALEDAPGPSELEIVYQELDTAGLSDEMQSHVSNTGTCLPLTSEDKLGVQNSPELSGTEACFSERTPQLSDEAVATTHSQSPSKFQGPTGSGIDEVFDDKDDTLSDIDDDEVKEYIFNEEEVKLKTELWTHMNKDYLEAQEAKQAALARSQAAQAAAFAAASSNDASAAELAAAVAAAVEEQKKARKRKRAEDASKRVPADTAIEATRQMLESKKLSSKVNYTVLAKLFDDPESES